MKIVPMQPVVIDRGWVDSLVLLVKDKSTIQLHSISIAPIACSMRDIELVVLKTGL
jgi:hypothetical protein